MVKVRVDLWICFVVSAIFLALVYWVSTGPLGNVNSAQRKVIAMEVDTHGMVGTKYEKGIPILDSMNDILESDDVFVLDEEAMLNTMNDIDEDSDGELWHVALVDDQIIPVKYNYRSETDDYTPIGKVIHKPAKGLDEINKWNKRYGEEETVIQDAYIDMDNGMQFLMFEEELRQKGLESSKEDMDDIVEKLALPCFILAFILHALAAHLGLLPPIIPKRRKNA